MTFGRDEGVVVHHGHVQALGAVPVRVLVQIRIHTHALVEAGNMTETVLKARSGLETRRSK